SPKLSFPLAYGGVRPKSWLPPIVWVLFHGSLLTSVMLACSPTRSRCLRSRHLLAKERGARPVPQTALLSAPSLPCLAPRAGHTARCTATGAEVTTYSEGFPLGVVQPWYGRVPVCPTRRPSARARASATIGGHPA